MNKLGIVLGAAAVAFVAGCMDPNYVPPSKRGQNDVKPVAGEGTKPVLTPDVTPVPEDELPGYPGSDAENGGVDISVTDVPVTPATPVTPAATCQCLPGTAHDGPCTCGAPDCKCVVKTPATDPAAENVTEYVVRPGDTLFLISKRFNIKLDSIRAANPQIKNDNIRAGQKIVLPAKVELGKFAEPVVLPQPPKPAPQEFVPYTGATTEYVVKNGDCLSVIARKNGITTKQLKVLNGLSDNNIRIGQKILIPASATAAAVAVAPVKQEKPVVKPVAVAEKKVTPPPARVEPVVEPKPPVVVEPEFDDIPVVEPVAPVVEDVKAAAAVPPPPAPDPNGDYISYVVMKGEDITALSISFGIDPSVIRELNNMGDDDQLVPGQTIRLPAEAQ